MVAVTFSSLVKGAAIRGQLACRAVIAAFAIASCAVPAEPRSSIVTLPDGLRTFTVIRELGGNPVTCGLPNVPDHVRGVLRGDAGGSQDPVWLETGGKRLSVVWPEGFRVRFEPEATLVNDRGSIVAREGEIVELTQVPMGSATGTYQDPYVASCYLFGETYVYKR